MDMKDSRIINAPQAKVWAALNDPAMLKQCIIGCDSLEATTPDTFVAAMSVKVGPVSAKFKGKLQLENVQPPNSYTLKFEGQGGPAGFANGTHIRRAAKPAVEYLSSSLCVQELRCERPAS